jgi:hypothetical protein
MPKPTAVTTRKRRRPTAAGEPIRRRVLIQPKGEILAVDFLQIDLLQMQGTESRCAIRG